MIENDKTVGVGLIGYGYAGKTFHAPLIRSVPGFALHVIGSSKREILEAEYP
jgi:predicted dehydrogenase